MNTYSLRFLLSYTKTAENMVTHYNEKPPGVPTPNGFQIYRKWYTYITNRLYHLPGSLASEKFTGCIFYTQKGG